MGRGYKRLGKVLERSDDKRGSNGRLENNSPEDPFSFDLSSPAFNNMGSNGPSQILSPHFSGGELLSSNKRQKSASTSSVEYLLKAQAMSQTQKPGTIGANISYARGSSSLTQTPGLNKGDDGWEENTSDEDSKFLRLAHDAVVATAKGAGNPGGLIIDPTIQDLLRRLQYASSPHGNPMKRSNKIRANKSGQLMVQDFYQKFPDLSNNIFTGNSPNSIDHMSLDSQRRNSMHSEDWNYLIGSAEGVSATHPAQVQEPSEATPHTAMHRPSHRKHRSDSVYSKRASNSSRDMMTMNSSFSGSAEDADHRSISPPVPPDASRKYLCSKCTQSFRRSSDLKRHEKQHLEIPPNICEQCGKGFARKDALKRHRGTLTCKRNAEKKLYTDNLEHLQLKGQE